MSETIQVPVAEDLVSFVNSFSFQLITVSVQPVGGVTERIPQLAYFSNLNRIRAFTVSEFLSPEVQAELHRIQQYKWGVFFTINEGDGLPDPTAEPDNLNCGKRSNIQTLKALCIDTDKGDAKALVRRLTELELVPHFIVETRPNRYHFYFLIQPVPKAEGLVEWEALQTYLATLVPDLDQSMKDSCQVLRLPGFYNFNGVAPHLIRILRAAKHDLYDLKTTHDRLGAFIHQPALEGYVNGHGNGNSSAGYTRFEPPAEILKEGNRRQMITRYMEHLMENTLELTVPDYDYWVMIDAFIKKYVAIHEQPDFLEGGSRRRNLEQYFDSQKARRIQLRQQEEAQRASLKFDAVQAVEEEKLPDSFYLEFPGDLGMLTREIHAFHPALGLELCFAGALIISGALKAESFRFKGAWPLLNGIVSVDTAGGKSTLIRIVEEVFRTAGMAGEYAQYMGVQTSVQSLHTAAYRAGGVSTLLADEAGDYLKAIAAKNAPSYAMMIRSYFKKATVGGESGAVMEPGESLSLRVPARFLGFLSVWLFIQPSMLRQCIGLDDMSDGLLPRFLIFKSEARYDAAFDLDIEHRTFVPSQDLRVWIEQLALLAPHSGDERARTAALEGIAQYRAAHPRAGREEIARARLDAVFQLRSEARAIGRKVEVTLTSEAETALRAYMFQAKEELMGIVREDSSDPRKDVLLRIKEMLSRFICNAAPSSGLVGVEIVEAAVKYMSFTQARFFARELKEMGENRELRLVVEKVAELCRKKKDAVTAREIGQGFKSSRRPKNLSSILKEAVALGELWEDERSSDTGKRKLKVFGVHVDEVERLH